MKKIIFVICVVLFSCSKDEQIEIKEQKQDTGGLKIKKDTAITDTIRYHFTDK